MYFFIMMMIILTSIMFSLMNHPMSMGFILLIQTILISLITGFLSYSFWFSYILLLILVGGMLVLFIYMTSLASNEMFKFSSKMFIFIMMYSIIMMMIYLFIDKSSLQIILKTSEMKNFNDIIMNLIFENSNSLMKIYNTPINFITLMLINYLFLTLIAVVKITNINMGPLRKKN
uniref:NADH-ubiquinone oxidoreductase chain 6 n=1 Tax=Hydroscapha granulum TaxID=426698 RepID=B9ZSK4_HYDGN|nr:NADH dehydrogenase subunit 6 [Hydroscapha granulum]CAM35441.1 NADH dehydrogenase subunit 6 [Hydroscapha granulum]